MPSSALAALEPQTAEFQCPQCPKTFTTEKALTGHIGGAHSTSGNSRKGGGKGHFPCPECERSFKYARVLGKHRKAAHGVAGSSPSALARIGKKGDAASSKKSVHLSTGKGTHASSNGVANASQPAALDPIAYAIAVGSVKEFCRNFAEEHEIPARMFTRQFAELFLREARR